MLGEMIGELTGKVAGYRVLSVECCPQIENTFQESGKLLEVDVVNIGTVMVTFNEDGSLCGEGQGLLKTNENECATWKCYSKGRCNGKASEWRSAIFFNTKSTKLARLNSIVGIDELNVDEEGNIQEKIYEWK